MAVHAPKREDEVIPVNDVPAFGVQIRFVTRVMKDMLAQLRKRRNGSSGSTKPS